MEFKRLALFLATWPLLCLGAFGSVVLFVDAHSTNAVPPFASWATAASVIQDAIDWSKAGDTVLVTNGVYQVGGRALAEAMSTNRVAITNSITLQSVNGPEFTIIQGYQVPQAIYGTDAVRCAFLGDGAVMIGFKLTNGATSGAAQRGGAVWCQSSSANLSNCVLVGNAASFTGGAVFQGTLNGCTLSSNYSGFVGGAADSATLINCTLLGNTAKNSGGAVDSCIVSNCSFIGNRAFVDSGGDGGGAARASSLNNCILTGNSAPSYGGGAYDCRLTNCVLLGNSCSFWGGGAAYCNLTNCTLVGNSAKYGGGAHAGQLLNCTILSNSAISLGGGTSEATLWRCNISSNSSGVAGGGAYQGALYNCQLVGNRAAYGGGASSGSFSNCSLAANSATNSGGGTYTSLLNNCIVYYNDAPTNENWYAGTLNCCCTFPLPTNGINNITEPPLFVDLANTDLHLQSNSPCLNSGCNGYTPAGPDFEGALRLAGGTVDIGAYEFQSPNSTISYAWLQQHGFPHDGSADESDPDADGMSNWQEWIAGSDPTNSASKLVMFSPVRSNSPPIVTLSWSSVTNRTYVLERSSNLLAQSPFSVLRSNIPGRLNVAEFTDTNAPIYSPAFYRVRAIR
jgi:hypothetical protein